MSRSRKRRMAGRRTIRFNSLGSWIRPIGSCFSDHSPFPCLRSSMRILHQSTLHSIFETRILAWNSKFHFLHRVRRSNNAKGFHRIIPAPVRACRTPWPNPPATLPRSAWVMFPKSSASADPRDAKSKAKKTGAHNPPLDQPRWCPIVGTWNSEC